MEIAKMNSDGLLSYKLPREIYRKLLILTDSWESCNRVYPGCLLFKAHSGGNKTPFFWCSAPNSLEKFFDIFGSDRSIYCFPGTVGLMTPKDETIKALGKYYAAEIMKIQPNGPYLLGGYCQAGLISHEIACNLEECGHQVGRLILLDVDMTRNDLCLSFARKLFFKGEKLFDRRQQFATDPKGCVKEIMLNYWHRFLLKPLCKVEKILKNQFSISGQGAKEKVAAGDNLRYFPGADLFLQDGYKLSPFHGKIHLIYIKWGILGFFQFKFFQKYWNKIAQGGCEFSFIDGQKHRFPDWNAVAKTTHKIISKMEIDERGEFVS